MDKRLVASLLVAVAAVAALYYYTPPHPPIPEKIPEPEFWETAACRDAVASWSPNGVRGVAVVAPASGLKMEGSEKARRMAASLGLALPDAAMKPGVVPYNANDDETRTRLFLDALNNPDVRVLWALRGGYGSGRLLDAVAKAAPPEKKKILVGYSDMTFLHQLVQRWGWPSVHGAMFWELASKNNDPKNFQLLSDLLAGKETTVRYDDIKPFNQAAEETHAPIKGVVRGGNLTCLAAGLGTPWAVDVSDENGVILFIEDVDEPGYKIDRMLTQLRLAGAFDSVKAILMGTFSKGDAATEFALERFAKECDTPIFRNSLFGHGAVNYPLVFNVPAGIERDEEVGEFSLIMDVETLK